MLIRISYFFLLLSCTCFSLSASAERLSDPLAVLAKKYKAKADYDAEVLEKRVSTHIDSNQLSQTTIYVAIRLNKQSAVDDYSQIDLVFNDYFENIHLDFANVLTAENKLVPVNADAIQIKSESKENFYEDTKSLAFSLPLTYAGSVIEFQYTLKDKRHRIDNYYMDGGNFHFWEKTANSQRYRADYVHFSEKVVYTQKALDIKYYLANNFKFKYKQKPFRNGKKYIWSIKDIKPFKQEPFIASTYESIPYIALSTVPDWNTIAQWSSKLTEPKIQSNNKIKDIATEIKEKYVSRGEQIKAAYNYMQSNIRYVFAHVGRGGYQPHMATEVLQNGYGDCKDQSVLLVTILRELGISAFPALVSTGKKFIHGEDIPRLNFDHMIVHIPKAGQYPEVWLDTVGGNFLFPGIDQHVDESFALIASNDTTSPTNVNNRLERNNKVRLEIDAFFESQKNLNAKFILKSSGYVENNLRNWLRYSDDKKKSIEKIFGSFYEIANLKNIQLDYFDVTDKEIVINGEFAFDYKIEKEKQAYGFAFNFSKLLNAFQLLPTLIMNTDERIHPFEFSRDITVEAVTTINKLPGYYVKGIDNYRKDSSVFNYQKTFRESIDSIEVKQVLTYKPTVISTEKYMDIYENYKSLEDTTWSVNMAYNTKQGDIENAKIQLNNKESDESYINFIKVLLDKGEYDLALEKNQEALEKHSNNGQLHYLYGLALAYLGKDEEAEKYFTLAEELGYEI